MDGDIRSTAGRLADLARRSARPSPPGHAADIARERIELLLDEGSFTEIDALREAPSSGAVAGFGTVDGRPVCAYSRAGGGMGEADGDKIIKIIDHAMAVGAPLVGIHEGTGPRLEEGLAALAQYGGILRRTVHASGVIPQLSIIMGSVTGADVQLVARADFVIMVDDAGHLAVSEPAALSTITGEDLAAEDLGATMHSTASGVVDMLAADEEAAMEHARRLLSHLPLNNLEDPPSEQPPGFDEEITELDRALDALIPDSPRLPYDIRRVVTAVLDDADLYQVAERYAPNVICGFGRIEGHSVGVVANQPLHLAGCLDIDAARKAARFVRTCDAFNLPVVTFVDAPGFVPSLEQEQRGLVRHSAQLIFAYAEATVPLITVTTRAAYGSAYVTMASKPLGADVSLAWPTARIAAADAQAAVGALHEQEIADHEAPESRRAELISTYEDESETPYAAAERGDVDAVIPPHRTRLAVGAALRLLRNKRAALPPKKHGNMPL